MTINLMQHLVRQHDKMAMAAQLAAANAPTEYLRHRYERRVTLHEVEAQKYRHAIEVRQEWRRTRGMQA